MRRLSILTLVSLLCFSALAPRAHVSTRSRAASKPYAQGQVIVKLLADAPALQFEDSLEREFAVAQIHVTAAQPTGKRGVEELAPVMTQARMRRIVSERGLDRVFILNIGDDADVEAAVAELRSRPDVEYAEPNFRIVPGSIIPDDPRFYDQWGLK